MAWIQLAIYTVAEEAEKLESILHGMGAVAVTLSDAADEEIFEPPPGEMPLWQSTKLTGLFEDAETADAILGRLRKVLQPRPLPQYEFSRLEDKDWERVWLDEFKPMQFGKRVWVVPTVYDPVDPVAVNIRLDPGLAFGTGTHPTTALCLAWLDGQNWQGQEVIDFGCGSGILGIAAAMLGAARVWAVDIDPQAVQATNSNAVLNNVVDFLTVGLPSAMVLPQVEVLVANILANPLCFLAEQFAKLTVPGGRIALSGILSEQAAMVSEAYAPWFDLEPIRKQEDWVLISGIRRS
ncbi:MAG: 50S ribosomal protein L11 methyltransferase [Gammaproteobacteria bacterium]|nr:50S ribosomal protein L11 methyltransferase [Gammaproteobacteria bacterium]